MDHVVRCYKKMLASVYIYDTIFITYFLKSNITCILPHCHPFFSQWKILCGRLIYPLFRGFIWSSYENENEVCLLVECGYWVLRNTVRGYHPYNKRLHAWRLVNATFDKWDSGICGFNKRSTAEPYCRPLQSFVTLTILRWHFVTLRPSQTVWPLLFCCK